MQIPEIPLVVEVAESALENSVSVPVSQNEPRVTAPIIEETPLDVSPANVQVEAIADQASVTSPNLTALVETANIIAEKVESNPTVFLSGPMIEAKPVDISPDETARTGYPASVEVPRKHLHL